MGLSIVIPAYNEQDRLGRTLHHLKTAWADAPLASIPLHEIIVVDDGSADRTAAIAGEWAAQMPVKCIRLPSNKGKGAAVRAGMQAATGEFILMYDADGATPAPEIAKLFAALHRDGSDIAIGSRVIKRETSLVTMQWHRRVIGRTYHTLCSLLVPGILDTACGCKLFTAAAAKRLFAVQRVDRFAFDVEVLSLALHYNYRISEVPLAWTAVPESKVRLLRDGLQMFWCVVLLYARKAIGR
jgi:dolichyl-phosphate beta-glucosyltransferase